jgi:16S rRNA (adenine(1408)-N(1))-methyltransferase
VTIDVGTGDGRAVLAAAAREPATLALGIDASAAAMAEASRRAARPARKGGLDNVRFLLAAAESLPAELSGRASRVTVLFPWGSLLRGCLGLEDAVACGVARAVAPQGVLELLLAPAERDGLAGVPTNEAAIIEAARRAFAPHGLRILEARTATPDEIAATGSSWARRLGVAGRRNGSNGHGKSNGSNGADRSNGANGDRSPVLIRLARR